MKVMRTGAVAGLLLSSMAAASPTLDRARALVGDLKYAEAGKVLQAAEAATGNTRADLIEIYELEGIVFGSLNKAEAAQLAFARLLSLDPEHKLNGKFAPRVTTPFYEAKGKAHEMGPLTAVPGAGYAAEKVTSLGFTLKDPASIAKKLIVTVSEDGKPWRKVTLAASQQLLVPVSATQLYWFAVVLGDHDAVLLEVASAAAPTLQRAPTATIVEPRPEPQPEPAPEPVARVEPPPPAPEPAPQRPPEKRPRLRPLAITLGVLGSISALVCVSMILSYNQNVSAWNTAARAPDGTITGITRDQAVGYYRGASNAISFGWGAGLLTTIFWGSAAVIWWLGTKFAAEERP
jgi:hypothetical protein